MLDLAVGEVEPGPLLGMEKMNVGSGAACPGSDRAKLGAEFEHVSSPAVGFYPSLCVRGRIASTSPSCGHLLGEDPIGAGAASIPPASQGCLTSPPCRWVGVSGGSGCRRMCRHRFPGECLAGVTCIRCQTGRQLSVLQISTGAQKTHRSPRWRVFLCCRSCREHWEEAGGSFCLLSCSFHCTNKASLGGSRLHRCAHGNCFKYVFGMADQRKGYLSVPKYG